MSSTPTETEQLRLWKGAFGDQYVTRNSPEPTVMRQLTRGWAQIMQAMHGDPPASILEVGSNIGLNLRTLRFLTDADLYAVEPNDNARAKLVADGVVPAERALEGIGSSIPMPDASVDLVFTHGVMIHIHPRDLPGTCREMFRVSRKYIACAEYYSDKLREIPYHGNQEALFTQDFGQHWLDTCPELTLVDYGFLWKGAGYHDNMTWWIFRKD